MKCSVRLGAAIFSRVTPEAMYALGALVALVGILFARLVARFNDERVYHFLSELALQAGGAAYLFNAALGLAALLALVGGLRDEGWRRALAWLTAAALLLTLLFPMTAGAPHLFGASLSLGSMVAVQFATAARERKPLDVIASALTTLACSALLSAVGRACAVYRVTPADVLLDQTARGGMEVARAGEWLAFVVTLLSIATQCGLRHWLSEPWPAGRTKSSLRA